PSATNLTNTTALGYNATPTASNQVRIGNTNVTSIGGKVSWSTFSDGRFKKDVKEDVSGLEFINQLRPVSYTLDENAIDKFLRIPDSLQSYNTASRKIAVRQTGFIAQEVEAIIKKTGYIFHGVEAPQNERDHYAIRYAEFVVPLVKAVQELSKEVEVLKQQLANSEKIGGTEPPVEAILSQNTPNPFSRDTEIKISLPETTRQASLIIYTLEGKQLKVIPIRDRGNTAVTIPGNEMSHGMYLYTLIVDGRPVDTKRMILTGY
ncbi:MAG TPA: tail fiber domain-containing protein, partial [Chryseolinea sp.]|nr:tail fiber domain-containing protein [Chryseolinea sp.]